MRRRVLAAVVVVIVLALGAAIYWWGDTKAPATRSEVAGVVQDGSGRRILYWYDPMVPGQRFDRPGKSPFMDMQLAPKYADEVTDAGVRISPAVAQNLAIRTARAERTSFGETITAVGRLEADERRRYALPSRVAGYVERLYVRAAGDSVAKGEKIAEIYSPELLSAQQEYLTLLRASNLSAAESLVHAARRRLSLSGMAEREIGAIEDSGAAQTRFGVYAPATGYVAELDVREGAEIEAGATLMSIADLSSLWLIAEVPEREASRLRAGAHVTAMLESAAGPEFSGAIDFVYPTLNPQTRTTRVRVVVPNERLQLRPGMFARVHLASDERDALSVPSEAVIYTGERTVVIVREDGAFRPVEVKTGGEAGGRTEILAGLEAGEEVVASGQFLIDSEASLNGVLARMSPTGAQDRERRSDSAEDAASGREDPVIESAVKEQAP